MRLIVTALLFVAGLFFAFVGVGFLLNPVSSATDFAITTSGLHGLSTIRGDMAAFFLVAGLCMVWGAWRRRGDPLLVSAALFGIAFTGRLINLVAEGSYEGWWVPMLVELLSVVLSLVASRMLPHRIGPGGIQPA